MFKQLQNLDLYNPLDLIEKDGKINEVKMEKILLNFFNVKLWNYWEVEMALTTENMKSSLPAFLLIMSNIRNELWLLSEIFPYDATKYQGLKILLWWLVPEPHIRVFHDRPVWCISVRLSDRSEVSQNKINFDKNCPQFDPTLGNFWRNLFCSV